MPKWPLRIMERFYIFVRNLSRFMRQTSRPAVLLLEDGKVFYGRAVGAMGTTVGELCFNTGMTGYQEIFTDPSYFRQILVLTHVHIGNYGIHAEEDESRRVQISGLVCRHFEVRPSRAQASEDIQRYFERQGIVAIEGVDTRAIVTHIRSKGAMNAILSSETLDLDVLRAQLERVPSMAGMELASQVTTEKAYVVKPEEDTPRFRVALLDYGVKRNIIRQLTERGVEVHVFPARTPFEEMERVKPHGYLLSNGPGDPAAMDYAVDTARSILDSKKPVMGICLGHQILCRALGMQSKKMFHGHRGINHPVKNLLTGRCEITSQNHGFTIVYEDAERHPEVRVSHVNLNDGTLEGIVHQYLPIVSVQYHPEASPGPHDSRYLFDDFISYMETVGIPLRAKSLLKSQSS